jgi:large subunit ribosomal protein L15e
MKMKKAYQYIKESIAKNMQERKIEWRKQNSVLKVDKPTIISRARTLGYKDKKGFVVVRVRVARGGHKRSRPNKGRKVQNLTVRKSLKINYQRIAEQRASKNFSNLEVLSSYKVAKDGKHYWFEVIMIDASKPEIKKDKNISWISKDKNKGRVFRGLTSAGKKSRAYSKQ